MTKKELEKRIKEILVDGHEYWQPDTLIQEKQPFWWRINPIWVEDKAKEIMNLIEEEQKDESC